MTHYPGDVLHARLPRVLDQHGATPLRPGSAFPASFPARQGSPRIAHTDLMTPPNQAYMPTRRDLRGTGIPADRESQQTISWVRMFTSAASTQAISTHTIASRVRAPQIASRSGGSPGDPASRVARDPAS
jgi:hypothetical protein